jgi:hypothetical protein
MPLLARFSFTILIFLYAFISFTYYPKWQKQTVEAVLTWDVSGYYCYLPAIFIYKDTKKVAFKPAIFEKYMPASEMYQTFAHPSGAQVMKYSAGMAVMYAPFFFVAHALAPMLGYAPDGFSKPYQVAIGVGGVLISLLGLWFLLKVLLLYVSERIAILTLFLVAFGTNYFDYAVINSAMPHTYLFTLYAILLYTTVLFYKTPTLLKAILIGGLAGLATLARPTEIISLLIPLLWEVENWATLKARIAFFYQTKTYFIAALCIFLLFISIQLVYWKYVSGSWVVYSYQEQSFNFLKPHLLDCFFSFRKGWLIYTPTMIFGLLGFFTLWKEKKELFWVLFVFSSLFIWIAFSWDIWWYGGSLGQRAMVQAYPILAIPMGIFMQKHLIDNQLSIKKILIIGLSLLFTYHNLWLTHQAHKGGLIDVDAETKPYFLRTLWRWSAPIETKKLLDGKDVFEGTPQNAQLIYDNNFESDTTKNASQQYTLAGKQSILLNKTLQHSAFYDFKIPTTNSKKWLRATITARFDPKEWDTWRMTQFILHAKNGEAVVRERVVRMQRMWDDPEAHRISVDMRLPDKPITNGTVHFWNADSDKRVILDNLSVEIF